MANDIKEIGDIVKQCKILLLDIEGTTTSISFVKDKLFPYAEENVQKFLESEWETDDVKEVVIALRKLALEDQESKLDGVVTIPAEDAPKAEQIAALVSSVKWQMASDRKVGALKQLQGLIWKQGYDNGDIKGHVYDDVASALEQWRSTEGQKVYIYSSGSVQAQKLLFGQSLAGDLLPRIDGHFDTAVGAKQDAASYTAIVSQIDAKPEEILFLTDIVKEAEAASSAGMHAALVSREGNAPLPADLSFPVIRSLAQLAGSNKRKPDQMAEETPAKVLKTDAEKDVKAAAAETVAEKAAEETKEQEKMEVESEKVASVEQPTEPVKEEVKVVTVIEEITDSNEPVDAPMIDVEPLVEEENKTEEKETEIEAAKSTNGNANIEPKENSEITNKETEVLSEKVPSGPIIEEIVSDKVDVMDTAEVAPVVEEPPAVEDMEVLQNVGEVLDKECDDILSKVQDVTNLDSIPVKPLLNSIAEETMETENLDSNDIVDRILDTEELELKQKEILDAAASETTKVEENGISHAKEANGVASEARGLNGVSNKDNDENSIKEVLTEKCSVESQDKKEETPVTEKESPAENIQSESVEKSEEIVVDNVKPVEDSKSVPETPVEEVKTVDESSAPEVKATVESHAENNKTTETSKSEENNIEPQMNGKARNGDSAPNMNGDAAKEDELCSRLDVETANGTAVNGSNGDSAEQGQGDSKIQEIADIKVKTVAAVEPPAEPIDQPTEA